MAVTINSVKAPLVLDTTDNSLSIDLNCINIESGSTSPLSVDFNYDETETDRVVGMNVSLGIDETTLGVEIDSEDENAKRLKVLASATGQNIDDIGLDYAMLGMPGMVYMVSEDGMEATWDYPNNNFEIVDSSYSYDDLMELIGSNIIPIVKYYSSTSWDSVRCLVYPTYIPTFDEEGNIVSGEYERIIFTGIRVNKTLATDNMYIVKGVVDKNNGNTWDEYPVNMPDDNHINALIDAKLGVIENGSY